MSPSCLPRLALSAALLVVCHAGPADAQRRVPTIDEMVGLARVGTPALSPDGRLVAYTVREANWEEDAFETEVWLAEVETGTTRQLTNAPRSSSAPAWSPDGGRLAFLTDRSGKQQVHVIDLRGGESEAATSYDEGVETFAWAPDGRSIAFVANDPVAQARKDRDKKFGDFEVVDEDLRFAHLHLVDLVSREVRRLTEGSFVVGGFSWSPDGFAIAFDHRPSRDPSTSGATDISIVQVSDGAMRSLVTQPSPDSNPRWSPDGRTIAFESAMGSEWFYYTNRVVATIPAAGGDIRPLTTTFDEQPSIVTWTQGGLYFSASERTAATLFRLDPSTGTVTRLGPADGAVRVAFSLDRDATRAAFLEADAARVMEIVVAPAATLEGRRVTDVSHEATGWDLGTREVISWRSTDGTEIEGVLHKPSGFTAGRRYPLLVLIHGGPTGISRTTPLSTYVYPVPIWLAQGALVLEPNYRGSAGYGERFRSLNVRNLGIGDSWDVVSGVDHLVTRGLVDGDRVGTMGWSQGGYISAFLATHDSARFKAASVGAGISNWMTYYVNTDIHPFTRQYLRATPWDDPDIYAKTSPMTYITRARTPTLIQHGENDRRVPIPNAFELYQGLQDQGVPTRLIVYKGFGHGLTKPKAQRAAMEHNLEWFDRHLFAATGTTAGSR